MCIKNKELCIKNDEFCRNNGAIHGRTAYQPAFDGEDRWLQRLSTHPVSGAEQDAKMRGDYFRENLVDEMVATQKMLAELKEQNAGQSGRWQGTAVLGAAAGALGAFGWQILRSRL